MISGLVTRTPELSHCEREIKVGREVYALCLTSGFRNVLSILAAEFCKFATCEVVLGLERLLFLIVLVQLGHSVPSNLCSATCEVVF